MDELYKNAMLLGGCLVSALVTDFVDALVEAKAESEIRESGNLDAALLLGRFGKLLRWLLLPLLCYVIVTLAAILAYAIARSLVTGVAVPIVLTGVVAYVASFLPEYCAYPAASMFVSWLICRGRLNAANLVVAGSVMLAMLLSSVLAASSYDEGMPAYDEILAQLRAVPAPYEPRLLDPEHFRESCARGYGEGKIDGPGVPGEGGDTGPGGGSPRNGSEDDYPLISNPTTLREMIVNVHHYIHAGDSDSIVRALSEAYGLYERGGQADANSIGLMWHYKGRYEDPEYYRLAAEAFVEDEEYANAADSYGCLFEAKGRASDALRGVECCVASLREGENDARAAETFKMLFEPSYEADKTVLGLLDEMCGHLPDDAFLNATRIGHRIAAGEQTGEDAADVARLLAAPGYASCPKLLILRGYLDPGSGAGAHSSELYEMYLADDGSLEPEDRLNLAWLLYVDGEYVKAYDVAAREQAALLCAEAYLQGRDSFPDMDEARLYDGLARDGSGGPEGDRSLVVRALLGSDLGMREPRAGLSEVCRRLFGDESVAGLFIAASLDLSEGDFGECVSRCDAMLGLLDAPDGLYDRVLFLKADALVGLGQSSADGDARESCFVEAETILKEVRDRVGNDYVACLERLESLYRLMGTRERDLQDVNERLLELR